MKKIFDIGDFAPVLTEQAVNRELIKRFKLRRKEKGFTQKVLSIRSGVSYASIRRFETSGEISFTSLLRLSTVLDCLEDFESLFKDPIVSDLRNK